jgi:probable rRNA maturation factor
MNDLWVWNRQRVQSVHLPLLRQIIHAIIAEQLEDDTPFEIGIYLVGSREMAQLNQTFLNHSGSTDVITFPYTDLKRDHLLQGEIFVSVDDAMQQAHVFRTSWQAELVRYVLHGILHLQGHDDLKPAARRLMKREEDRLLKRLGRRFRFSDLRRKRK